jgi:quercetin dioxygenase-like cupin family protein
MKIARTRSGERGSEIRTDTFTGTVVADVVMQAQDGVAITRVYFLPGARTHWHSHEGGQALHIDAGRGWVCASGSRPEPVAAGDTVWAPPGEKHWHGGSASTILAHTAVSLGQTTWLEPVADADYPGERPGEGLS